jgi:hypothetical protein
MKTAPPGNSLCNSRSLQNQINGLERQLFLRRQRVRTVGKQIKHKITIQAVSPGMLMVAAGIGVLVEQTSHHRTLAGTNGLDLAYAGIGLLMSLTAPKPQAAKHEPRLGP